MQKRCRGNYAWLTNSLKKTAILLSLNRPKTNTELKRNLIEGINLSEKSNLRLGEFVERNIIKCLNPRANKGRIYALTDSGLRLARRIASEQGYNYQYSNPPIDYKLCAWLTCGPRRKKLLSDIAFLGRVRIKDIKNMPRSYKYKLLDDFQQRGLIKKETGNGVVLISITDNGRKYLDVIFTDSCS